MTKSDWQETDSYARARTCDARTCVSNLAGVGGGGGQLLIMRLFHNISNPTPPISTPRSDP